MIQKANDNLLNCVQDNTLDSILMGILDGDTTPLSQKRQEDSPSVFLNKDGSPAFSPKHNKQNHNPLMVMHAGVPVVIEDPARFRSDVQSMLMMTMTMKQLSETDEEHLYRHGTMVEIATYRCMKDAIFGDGKAYQYMMDRLLGKPINQTNSVNVNVTYDQYLNKLNGDEVIEPEDRFVEAVVIDEDAIPEEMEI